MRHLFVVILLTLLLIVPIEARAGENPDVPNQDMIYLFKTPFGLVPVPIPKGALNANMETIYWTTPGNWERRYKAEQKRLEEERKSNEDFLKKYPELFTPKEGA